MRAGSFKRLLDRLRSMLDKTPLVHRVPQGLVERVRILSMVTARHFDAAALVLPSETFGSRNESTTHAQAVMIGTHRQRG